MKLFSGWRTGIFFTVVYLYIIGSFVWWWWLLQSNNKENYETLIQRERITYMSYGRSEEGFYDTPFFLELERDYHRKTTMLIGEGIVFISLISLGFVRLRNTFREELALTRQQNNFLLSITHELKSPLASLKLSMQTMQKHDLERDKVRRLADISMNDVDRLEALVENILLASKMDSSDFSISRDPFLLSDVARQIFNRTADKHATERIFSADIAPEIYLLGDRLIFSSVIYNLLENAIKYSRQGDRVELLLRQTKDHIVLEVRDTGIGIADEEKPRVFQRFYRVGREETRTTKGTGLGLFIVKQAVHFHQGTISVSDNLPQGTRFIIHIPVEK